MQAVNLRLARPEEAALLLQIHHASVQGLCQGQYNAEQIAHWFDGRDETAYAQGLIQQRLWLACAPEPVGFIELDADSIDKLFVLPQAAGLGVGKALLLHGLQVLQAEGKHTVDIEATLTGVPFYQKHGFHILEQTQSKHGGADAPLAVVKMRWQAA